MIINDVVRGILRSRGERLIKVLAEGPLPENTPDEMAAMRFARDVAMAVDEVSKISGDRTYFPESNVVPRAGFQIVKKLKQGNSKTTGQLLSSRLPREWKTRELHLAVGTEVEPSETLTEIERRAIFSRISVVSCSFDNGPATVSNIDSISFVNIPAREIGNTIKSVLLSEYLRSCFPYTIWSPNAASWKAFLEKAAERYQDRFSKGPDPMMLHYGVPASDCSSIDEVWAEAAQSLFSSSNLGTTTSDELLVEAIAGSWSRYGGALDRRDLLAMMPKSTNKVFAARPRIQNPDRTLRSVMLSGDAEIVMTLNSPSARHQEEIRTLLNLKNYGRHQVGFVQTDDIPTLNHLFENQSLVRFDARCLRLALGQQSSGT